MYHQVCTDFSEEMVYGFILKLGPCSQIPNFMLQISTYPIARLRIHGTLPQHPFYIFIMHIHAVEQHNLFLFHY
jgi:hypothetical protein